MLFVLGMLCVALNSNAPEKAGEEGWSVIVTFEALARALIIEGRAAPDYLLADVNRVS